MIKQSISQIVVFYHVVDAMNFSKAADKMGLSKAYVSKQIADLEKTLGTKLLERTTRQIELTFAGSQLFEHSRNIIVEFNKAEQTIAAIQNKPEGLLRITAPSAFAAHILAPILPQFLKKYPDIRLDLKLTGQELDLLKEKIDVAIRLTHNPPEDRIAKLIGDYQLQVCATRSYLKKHKDLKNPHQLTEHPCLVYATEKNPERWPFMIDEKEAPVFVTPKLACNTYEILLSATLSDTGIARLPSYVIQNYVEKKQLIVLFSEYMPAKIPIYAIYAHDIHMPPMIRVFIEFLQDVLNK